MFETVKEMVTKISAAGFEVDGLEDKLFDFLKSGVGVINLEFPVGDQWQRISADLDIYRETEQYLTWHHYYLRSPRQDGAFEHFINNGIDSRDLEKRFAGLDWSEGMQHRHWLAIEGIGDFGLGYAEK